MREPLCKSPEQALVELKQYQMDLKAIKFRLQEIQSKYLFTEVHGADEDFNAGILDPLYQAEKASNTLLDKLVDKIEAINQSKPTLGCKVKTVAA